ncbi:MAG: hypothetical protein V4555_05895, partial [Acidobacteriota bacterium]
TATWCAVGINLGVALIAVVVSHFAPYTPSASDVSTSDAPAATKSISPVLISIALSGLCALAAEVVIE